MWQKSNSMFQALSWLCVCFSCYGMIRSGACWPSAAKSYQHNRRRPAVHSKYVKLQRPLTYCIDISVAVWNIYINTFHFVKLLLENSCVDQFMPRLSICPFKWMLMLKHWKLTGICILDVNICRTFSLECSSRQFRKQYTFSVYF